MNILTKIRRIFCESESEYEKRKAKSAARALRNYKELIELAVLASLSLNEDGNSGEVKRKAEEILRGIQR